MGARELHHALECAGFRLLAEGEMLLVWPVANLLPELRRQIIEHKPELLAIAPRRQWNVSIPGREPFGLTCVQGINRAELLARYPAGTIAEAQR
jgi:hypothetical protein